METATSVLERVNRPGRKAHREWFKTLDSSAKRQARDNVSTLIDNGHTEAQAWSVVFDAAHIELAPAVAEPPAERKRAAVPDGITFTLNGKPRRNLSDLAYDATRNMLDDAPRMTATQFRAWLASKGIEQPDSSSWTLELPNGNTVTVAVP